MAKKSQSTRRTVKRRFSSVVDKPAFQRKRYWLGIQLPGREDAPCVLARGCLWIPFAHRSDYRRAGVPRTTFCGSAADVLAIYCDAATEVRP